MRDINTVLWKIVFCIFVLVDLDHQIKCNNQSKEEMQFLNNDYIHSGKQDLLESRILVYTHCCVLKKHLGKFWQILYRWAIVFIFKALDWGNQRYGKHQGNETQIKQR